MLPPWVCTIGRSAVRVRQIVRPAQGSESWSPQAATPVRTSVGHDAIRARTLSEVVYGQRAAGVLGQELEGDVGLALADHQMDDDQALVDNGPGRVAQAVGEGAEDLGDACLAGVGGDEDVLDILGLGRGELSMQRISIHGSSSSSSGPGRGAGTP